MDDRDFWVAAYLVALRNTVPKPVEGMMSESDRSFEMSKAAAEAGLVANRSLVQYNKSFGGSPPV